MDVKKGYVLVITIVSRGWSDPVLEAAKSAGAQGATVLHGRGAGAEDIPKLFGIAIEPEKEIILNAVPESISMAVLEAVTKAVALCDPGTGISMVLPLSAVVGIVDPSGPC